MKFVDIDKRSKKEQKAFHSLKRGSWQGVNPVTRTIPNKKRYDRNAFKKKGAEW